jgi:RHS repeat-associated protein
MADGNNARDFGEPQQTPIPAISLPKGGGAIRGIAEKFAANPVTGTGSFTVPIATSPGRSGFGPALSLSYDSGAGNGAFGFGWSLSLPCITRKTEKGLPRYADKEDSDQFILSGAEDLVPVPEDIPDQEGYHIRRYRPRVDGLFARIERWTNIAKPDDVHWRSISRDNILTIFGLDDKSRIADSKAPYRIFRWLIAQTRDLSGNGTVFEYKSEDGDGIDISRPEEESRGPLNAVERTANRYLKAIHYGNRKAFLDATGARPVFLSAAQLAAADWMFEVVFDYGEHPGDTPLPAETAKWKPRLDPFSSYRSCFEIRTYRLCRRVLMFHHFPGEQNVDQDCLVRSTSFEYRETPVASYLTSVTSTGHKRSGAGYEKASMPPVEFEYSEPALGSEVETLEAESATNLPYGVDGWAYQWTDLDGEGLLGILSDQAEGWFYKRNESPLTRDRSTDLWQARFAAEEQVSIVPSMHDVRSGWQVLDLAGDGQPDLVRVGGDVSGFYERLDAETWAPFRPFHRNPNLAWTEESLRLADLTGDGHADVLIADDAAFTWHEGLSEHGFGPANPVHIPWDDDRGPRVVFADETHSIFLADMSGDGLPDIVRIRNGELCYWPNLGYGRFGGKITMNGSPWFDTPDQFDPQRIRLADIDGSGVADIIYLGRSNPCYFLNESGNGWSEPRQIPGFPPIDEVASVSAVDLLGAGTACLVWSSPLPGDGAAPIKYLPLMNSKPHLLTRITNNLGAETQIHYLPSTWFYLRDKAEGNPWIARLPFPVHVVDRIEIYDHIGRNLFVSTFAYHHGHYDGVEREFAGFGMVEQWDTETYGALTESRNLPAAVNIDAATHVPPLHTKTWFHTGVFLDEGEVSRFYARLGKPEGEYYREPAWSDDDDEASRRLLPDTLLPDDWLKPDGSRVDRELTANEQREACRALRGSLLRQEVYADDGSLREKHPYSVSEGNFTIELLQPQGKAANAVFLVHPRESLVYQYERSPEDPRVSHTVICDVDAFGNTQRSVTIGYARRNADNRIPDSRDRAEQTTLHIVSNETEYTAVIDRAFDWRTPLVSETRTYEITGQTLPAAALRFTLDQARNMAKLANEISYEKETSPGALEKRLIDQVRTYFRSDDLTARLPLHQMETRALPLEVCRLVFTPGLIADAYGNRVSDSMLQDEGRYVHSEGDSNWWTTSTKIFYSPDPADSAAKEFDFARTHFFLPHRFRSAFHTAAVPTETILTWDGHKLLPVETRSPLGSRVTAGQRDKNGALVRKGNDYRVLQPWLTMDANRNCVAVAYDALGMPAARAVMGKPEETLGDFINDALPPVDIPAVLSHPLDNPEAVLGSATERILYDVLAYYRTKAQPSPQPPAAYLLMRETHVSDLQVGQHTLFQHRFSYSDGFGREIQTKMQAEPEMQNGNPGPPRWTTTGWTIFNNKGQPVREYEPFFSPAFQFEFDKAGVSSVLFYDAPGRVMATLNPDHSYSKVVFDAWQQTSWDANDTFNDDPRTDPDIKAFTSPYFAQNGGPPGTWLTWRDQRLALAADDPQRIAAEKAQAHAGTPTTAYFDSLGRPYLTISHNGFLPGPTPTLLATRAELDIENNQTALRDAAGRIAVRYRYDIAGNLIHQFSMEAGQRWKLYDVAGNPLRSWDSRGHAFRAEFDPLRRPVRSLVAGIDPAKPAKEFLTERILYGEQHPDAEDLNLSGQVYLNLDQSGATSTDSCDFKGNSLQISRRISKDYKQTVDWGAVDAVIPVPPAKLNLIALENALQQRVETEAFVSTNTYDALNRAVTLTLPHNLATPATTVRPTYNQAALLEKLDANVRAVSVNGQPAWTTFVSNVDYDAKGRRSRIDYGNGTTTLYDYDPLTFRLLRLRTKRNPVLFPADCPKPAPPGWPGCGVQDLQYTYDAVGNVCAVVDAAQQTIFFRNKRVDPKAEYTYDAIYRLLSATGREHLGQLNDPVPHSFNDSPRVGIAWAANDGNVMGTYIEEYVYDAAGNMREMKHRGTDPAHPGWTRSFAYDAASLIEDGIAGRPLLQNNRLTSSQVSTVNPLAEQFVYDTHGNLLRAPHLGGAHPAPNLEWNEQDRLSRAELGGGGTAWYVYDSSGERVRKVWEKSPGLIEERIYVGSCEIFRRRSGAGPAVFERETLHIMDEQQRVASVETRTIDVAGNDAGPAQLIRYQYSNHLGSAVLELDQDAQIITYEEYSPYGNTTYQAVVSNLETPKRIRFSGRERDEETGFNYHGARYCAPWLARWISCDPTGLADGVNLYRYAHDSPIGAVDNTGTDTTVAIPGVTPMTREDVVVDLARKAGWKVSGFKGFDKTTGKPIFEYGEKIIPKDREKDEAANIFNFSQGGSPRSPWADPEPQGPSIGPAGPDPEIQLQVGNSTVGISEDAWNDLQARSFYFGGTPKEGAKVFKLEYEDPDPDLNPEAQAAGHEALREQRYYEDRSVVDRIMREVILPALTAPTVLLGAAEPPPPPFNAELNYADPQPPQAQVPLFSQTQLQPLPAGVAPYQLWLFPVESYSYRRAELYGTPKFGLSRGYNFDHYPPVMEHYYRGIGGRYLRGFNQTPAERRAWARSWYSGAIDTAANQRLQGARMSDLSRQINFTWNLRPARR